MYFNGRIAILYIPNNFIIKHVKSLFNVQCQISDKLYINFQLAYLIKKNTFSIN